MDASGKIAIDSSNGGSPVSRTIDRASAGAHNAIDKVSDAAHPALDRVASGAHRAVDTVASATTQSAQSLGVKREQLRNAGTRAAEQCRGYVRANPATSVGIALAAGFLLSRLLRSR